MSSNINPNQLILQDPMALANQYMQNIPDYSPTASAQPQMNFMQLAEQMIPAQPQQANVSQQPTIPIDERIRQIGELRQNQEPISEMSFRDGNVKNNAIGDVRELGTGLSYIWTHPGETLGAAVDYFKQGKSLGDIYTDFANANLGTYNIDLRTIKDRTPRDIIGGVIQGAVEHPVYTFIDTLSLGLGGAAVKGLRNVPILGRISKATEIEKAISGERVGVVRDINKLENRLNNIKNLDASKGAYLEQAIEGLETGKTVSKEVKPVLKELKEFSREYDEFAQKYATGPVVGAEETAIVQKILRDRLKTAPEMTYEQVRREVVPILESGEDIKALAKEGNVVAKEVLGAKALYDKGRIAPVTHALANVEKSTATAVDGVSGLTDATRAGVMSNRLWGTSSYADIAKQLQKSDDLLNNLTKNYVNKAVSNAILRGELGGLELGIGGVNGSKAKFIDRGLLEKGELQKALDNMRKDRLLDTDIAVDAQLADELAKQIGSETGALKGATKDLYQTSKGNMLAQGTYLGANAITGAANAVINSNLGLIQDVIDAIKSKGRLSKEIGTWRRGGAPQLSNNRFLKGIQQVNRYTGGIPFGGVDRFLQNRFSEIAAHAELRKKGIPFAQRLDYVSQMDKAKLGELISDVRRTALINDRNIGILPTEVANALGILNPFYRWNITAFQSTARLLEKNPLLANTVLVDILGNIGFDKEMQNRLNLNVTLDKPYVSFKIDPKTGQMRQMSAEFIPMTTSLKTFDLSANNFAPSIPFFTSLMNATEGKDKYGNYMKRATRADGVITQTVGKTRYQYNPATGELEPIMGKIDEIGNAVIKEMFGLPTLVNRTLAPAVAPIFGQGGKFYQPYGESMFGSFNMQEADNNFVVGGNPLRGRTLGDITRTLGGVYESPYFESEDRGISPSQRRKFFRSANREAQRRMYGGGF